MKCPGCGGENILLGELKPASGEVSDLTGKPHLPACTYLCIGDCNGTERGLAYFDTHECNPATTEPKQVIRLSKSVYRAAIELGA